MSFRPRQKTFRFWPHILAQVLSILQWSTKKNSRPAKAGRGRPVGANRASRHGRPGWSGQPVESRGQNPAWSRLRIVLYSANEKRKRGGARCQVPGLRLPKGFGPQAGVRGRLSGMRAASSHLLRPSRVEEMVVQRNFWDSSAPKGPGPPPKIIRPPVIPAKAGIYLLPDWGGPPPFGKLRASLAWG
jgi:hypothetical protein